MTAVRGFSPDEALEALLAKLETDPRAPTSIRSPALARDVHIADSLAGLEVGAIATASRIADVGSGAGFPGMVLATALPNVQVDLIESSTRKCAYMSEALTAAAITNAVVVCKRSEDWSAGPPPAGGREAYDAVVIRAVGSLATDAELSSPLLREGGTLVVWKGERRRPEEDELAGALHRLAMETVEVLAVTPYPASRHRHLHVLRKTGATPRDVPRRPGAAAKRPLSG